MDPATAKTLVSAAMVVAVTLFSLVSFEMAFKAVRRDLKAVWAKSPSEARDTATRVTPSAAT